MEPYSGQPHERDPLDFNNGHNSAPRPPAHVDRRYSRNDSSYYDHSPNKSLGKVQQRETGYSPSNSSDDTISNSHSPPAPPPHGHQQKIRQPIKAASASRGREQSYAHNQSNITPGADNFGETASGGMAGIAYTVADHNARESGLQALRSTGQVPPPPSRAQFADAYEHRSRGHDAYANLVPIGGPGGASHPASVEHSPSRRPYPDPYSDDPYQGFSRRNGDPRLGMLDPNSIEDDGDEGLDYSRSSVRNSMLSSHHSDKGARSGMGGAAAAGGAVAAGRSLLGREGYRHNHDSGREKSSDWIAAQRSKSRKWKWATIIGIGLLIVGGIIGGVVGGFISGAKHNAKTSSGESAKVDTAKNGDLNIDSQEIKDLLKNPNLHKVFPGMDYTPINAQYPDCLNNPPSQNNVTRDVAVLSQLTNKIRLYGTDCNQTQMVLHAIKQLKMEDDIKVWMGVWQESNKTTNARQLNQMWEVLDDYGEDQFEGVIVANEVLFREQMTVSELGQLLSDVRQNLTDNKMSLEVATSDLANNWTSTLAQDSEYIMANVHPFFSGIGAEDAAAWTWNFWNTNDGVFFKTDKKKNIISETGWPSGGGTSCGGPDTCTGGSVAGIDEMNQYMNDWVCQALANGTQYFWFEAFDQPWQAKYNTPGKSWEDKWGLMDVNRNIKKGVKIPDCGGKTIS